MMSLKLLTEIINYAKKIIKSLYDTQKPFKCMGKRYTVTSIIIQKTEAALQTA